MAFLHQPISLNPITYSGIFVENGNSPTQPSSSPSSSPLFSTQVQTLSVYNREYGKDRGQLPSALVSACPTGADISAFGLDDDEETEDASSIPTERDDEMNERTGDENDVDVVNGDLSGEGYGANVRSVATYYRMPIASPTLPTVPTSAVSCASQTTSSFLPTAQVYKPIRVENVASRSSTPVVKGQDSPPTCYCCQHIIPTKTYLTAPCSHHYDPTCLQHLLTHSLHSLTLPTCCGTLIPTRSFLHLLPYNSAMRKAWLERELEMMALPGERERVYCPGDECGAFVGGVERDENSGARVINCPRCERKICTRCQREAHIPSPPRSRDTSPGSSSSCQPSANVDTAEDREFLRSSRQQGWQRCFSCRRIVEVTEGCYHVVCLCQAEWCYKCGNAWRPRSCDCGVFPQPSN